MIKLLLAICLCTVVAAPAAALPCLTKAQAIAKSDTARYRFVNGQRCWYTGARTPAKSEFTVDKRSAPAVKRSAPAVKSKPVPTDTLNPFDVFLEAPMSYEEAIEILPLIRALLFPVQVNERLKR
jgi:hypothetical protein